MELGDNALLSRSKIALGRSLSEASARKFLHPAGASNCLKTSMNEAHIAVSLDM